MTGSRLQRERDVAPGARRFIDPEDQLEGLTPRTAIGFGLRIASQDGQHVPVIALVAVPVNTRRIAVHGPDALVVRIKEQAQLAMARTREHHYLQRIKQRHDHVLQRYRKLAGDLDRSV